MMDWVWIGLKWLLIAIAVSPVVIGIGWAIVEGSILPRLIPREEIDRLADDTTRRLMRLLSSTTALGISHPQRVHIQSVQNTFSPSTPYTLKAYTHTQAHVAGRRQSAPGDVTIDARQAEIGKTCRCPVHHHFDCGMVARL